MDRQLLSSGYNSQPHITNYYLPRPHCFGIDLALRTLICALLRGNGLGMGLGHRWGHWVSHGGRGGQSDVEIFK